MRKSWSVLRFLAFLGLVFGVLGFVPASAQTDKFKRHALVIGIANYEFQSLPSSAEQDATLIANSFASQGYDVFGGRNLTQSQIVATLAEFQKRVEATRDSNLIAVYLAGRVVQIANQNFFLPADYAPVNPVELGRVGVRLTDLQAFLSRLAPKGHLLVIDTGNSIPVPLLGFRPVPGLATLRPVRNSAVAMNTTPGLLGADYLDPIGPYARALSEGIRRGAATSLELFNFVRLRQLESTAGDTISFFSTSQGRLPVFFPASPDPIKGVNEVQSVPMSSAANPALAFTIALGRGTPDALEEFNFLHPANPSVKRAKIILSAMKEARIWSQVLEEDRPESYWAYLKLYPRGGHSDEARYRLTMLKAALVPPADAPLTVISNPPASSDEASPVIEFSPVALDDERLRLQAAVLPYGKYSGPFDAKYAVTPVALAEEKNDLPVIADIAKGGGRITSFGDFAP